MIDGNLNNEKPLVLLIDMAAESKKSLHASGRKVITGTFGNRYFPDPRLMRPSLKTYHDIPSNFREADIVVINLSSPDSLPEGGQILTLTNGNIIQGVEHAGVIDPRPYVMGLVKADFDRIYSHGGIFVIFGEYRSEAEYQLRERHIIMGDNQFIDGGTFTQDNWSFLSVLSKFNLEIPYDAGNEINILLNKAEHDALYNLLIKYTPNAQFSCKYRTLSDFEWLPILSNKYGDTVGGVIANENDNGGLVFIFPHIKDEANFITQFINEYLPRFAPRLFPGMAKANWIEQPLYEAPYIFQLKNEASEIQRTTEYRLRKIEESITTFEHENHYLRSLLVSTGDELVDSVQAALHQLGFQSIVNIDKEPEEDRKVNKHEDLHIRDQEQWLLIEVKGILGTASNDEATQVYNYFAYWLRKKREVRGLTIVNHERMIEPIKRNPIPFNDEAIQTAENSYFGLITTWTIFRLLRTFQELRWQHKYIENIFFQDGLIMPIPSHYQSIGIVERFYPAKGAITIVLNQTDLRLGDRIAFTANAELPILFFEQDITSLQLDGKQVEVISAGSVAGTLTTFTKEQVPFM